eukprot:6016705-Lingulodinium_polyedra.AAC.1
MLENVESFSHPAGTDSPLGELNRHFDNIGIYVRRSLTLRTGSWINNNRSRSGAQQPPQHKS